MRIVGGNIEKIDKKRYEGTTQGLETAGYAM